ncbi:MAG: nickel pincer cofactor biosynthesis protein LarB [Methanobrevibacter arboriphilus]|uniref:Nickel pincer cofactor biosynthesis protein LarB n=1 Tax=Methanobrevibacter arboriphilus TaxID=39441 RepID=A0A843AHN7_METAZ|nr:nickel pincer cofactor biosynthesis protein LarB [Methanobrevibacter arboriphilus]MBF4469413.1 nickel pincer cofactor biosynthesis protein LarB [Methanobrevibacter arboriphilus]
MRKILEKLLNGEIDIETCENLLKANTILELDGIAKFDNNRKIRTGFPEAILAQGKDYNDLLAIIKGYFDNKKKNDFNNSIIITRLDNDKYDKLKVDLAYLNEKFDFEYNYKAKILIISNKIINNETNGDEINNESDTDFDSNENSKKIGIITAGTSDMPVAEEAKVIVEQGGCKAITSYDVGVAGIHRLFPQIAKMIEEGVCVIIVCAGMEGALPSVVAGLVDVPIIGVPTSVGYGIGGKGKAALYAMLQSCAPGLAVVNIDNGFGAGVFALTIAKNLK